MRRFGVSTLAAVLEMDLTLPSRLMFAQCIVGWIDLICTIRSISKMLYCLWGLYRPTFRSIDYNHITLDQLKCLCSLIWITILKNFVKPKNVISNVCMFVFFNNETSPSRIAKTMASPFPIFICAWTISKILI